MEQRKVVMYQWHELKSILKEIYSSNNYMSPYQSYEFLNTVKLGRIDKNPFATRGYKGQNFVLFSDEKPIAVAPLYSKKVEGKYDVLFRGALTSAGHLDLIYAETFSFDDYAFLMDYIKDFYKSFDIHFDRVSEKSLTYKYAAAENRYEMISSDMVSVTLPETYDDWYHMLSKSVRQNIRTRYNRLNTDGKTIKFDFYNRIKPDKKNKQRYSAFVLQKALRA